MATTTRNMLRVSGTPQEVARALAMIGEPELPVNFELAVPELRRDDTSADGLATPGTQPEYDWASWRTENWGTHWPLGPGEVEVSSVRPGAQYVETRLRFETVNSPPGAWFIRLCQQLSGLDVDVRAELASYTPGYEDAGKFTWERGVDAAQQFLMVGDEEEFATTHGLEPWTSILPGGIV